MSDEEPAEVVVHPKLLDRSAERFGVPKGRLLSALKKVAFRQRDGKEVTDDQMIALLIVADQYRLNPFTKELYAYADKDGTIVPVVSVDGWSRIINESPAMNGIDFTYAGTPVIHPQNEHKACPGWIECALYRKDRDNPIRVREYLDEVYVPPRGQYKTPGPWQSHTKRMLRHKALIQCARVAFGFAGIYDDDEAQRILERADAERTEGKNTPPPVDDEIVVETREERQERVQPDPQIEHKASDEVLLDMRAGRRGEAVKVTSGRSSTPYADAAKEAPAPTGGPPPLDDIEDAEVVTSDPESLVQALADIEDAEDMFALSAVLDEFAVAREEWSQLDRERFDEAYNRKASKVEAA